MVAGEDFKNGRKKMTDKDLDKRLKQLVDSYSESPDVDMWSGIESGLKRRKSAILLRRVAYYSAAAVVLIALILFIPNKKEIEGDIISDNTHVESGVEANLPEVVIEMPKSEKVRVVVAESRKAPDRIVRRVLYEGKDIIYEGEGDEEDVTIVVKEEVVVPDNNRDKKSTERAPERTIYDQTYQYRDLYADDYTARKNRVSLDLSSNYIQATGDGYGMRIIPPKPLPGDTPGNGADILPNGDPKYDIPLKFGLGIQYRINNVISIGTGVNFSILNSEYESIIGGQKYDIKQNVQYIGIPLNIYFGFVNNNSFRFYGNIGGAIDKALGIKYSYSLNGFEDSRRDPVSGVQFSARAGLGVEYKFNNLLGVYLDPSVAYYFESNQQVGSYPIRTIRSDRPFQVEFELGFRFNF